MLQPVQIKICGITRREDAMAAAGLGADFLGYIFHPKSKRFIPPEAAAKIVSTVRAEFPQVRHVGVFVDYGVDVVDGAVKTAGLDFAQLHGSESAAVCCELKAREVEVIKAFRFGAGAPRAEWKEFPAAFFLCDTFDVRLAGGTGRPFNLSLIPREFPFKRAFVAGGITADSVRAIVAAVRPFAIDVSTGVEAAPGIKSADLMRELFDAVRKEKATR